jgi:UDP-N-acetylglucosamine--N-acetylmuramyl-(pentapeptide) pyrophosphoryl-undecaprenol N-acetylglucosamine transferase
MANARAFEATGACLVIPHASFTPEALAGNLMTLFEAPQRLADMAAAAHGAGRPDAAQRLADLVGELIDVPALAPSGVAA